MKKKLRYKKGEPLHKWVERIADYWNFDQELREILSEVSKTSYIHGSNDAIETITRKKI